LTACALRRLERWCDPSGRLAASGRPSRGIAMRFEDVLDPAATRIGCVGPARRFYALRARPGSSRRADCSARHPPCAFRFPSEAHRITPAPSREPEGSARQTMLPSLGFRAPRHMPGRRTRLPQGVRPCGVPRPRFGASIAASTTVPPGALRPPSVHGLSSSRRSPLVGRTPSRKPLPSCRCARRIASPL